jgi:hypothetical protein
MSHRPRVQMMVRHFMPGGLQPLADDRDETSAFNFTCDESSVFGFGETFLSKIGWHRTLFDTK